MRSEISSEFRRVTSEQSFWMPRSLRRSWGSANLGAEDMFTLHVDRGRWVLLSATRPSRGTVRVHSSDVSAHRNFSWSTRSLLVYADVSLAILSSRPFELRVMDMPALIKLLAFHDDARGINEHQPSLKRTCVVEATHEALEEVAEARRWMVRGFMQQTVGFCQVFDVLRRTEDYRLVRFLLSQDPSVKASRLSERYGLSATHFRRKCRQVLGRSLKGELRLLRAARSLLEYGLGGDPFTTVAADHGYSSAAHFSSEVRSLFGKSPSELYGSRPMRKGGR